MKDFQRFVLEQNIEDLQEKLFRKFLSAVKATIQKVVKRVVSSFKKLRPGQKVIMKVPMPSTLKESSNTGKAGGELAEVALLNELFILLKSELKKNGVSESEVHERLYFNHGINRDTWKRGAYLDASNTYDGSAKTARDKADKDKWASHGKAAAKLLFQQLKTELGEDINVVNFQMLHEGQKEIGKSKRDFSIVLHKHNEEKLYQTLGFSMKATLDNSPYETPNQAYQSGYAAIALGFITGKYTKEIEDLGGALGGYSRMVNDLKKIEDPAERKNQLERIKDSYEKTYLYQLDKIGTEMGYGTSTIRGNELSNMSNRSLLLGQYLDALTRYFNDIKKERSAFKKEHGKSKGSHEEEFIVNVNDYIEILYDILMQKKEENETQIIRSILKFGGIEKDLYYIAAGVAPDDKKGSAAISTLFNNDWEKMRDTLLRSRSLILDVEKGENTKGVSNIIVRIKRKDGTTLVRFGIWKDRQDARISLPKFSEDGEYEKIDTGYKTPKGKPRMKTVDQSGLLRKYATGKHNID